MKITVRHENVRSTDSFDSWVEERILALEPHLQIDQAVVRLARDHRASPAYRVHVHLVTPGPDVLAYGADHTLRAATQKALTQVERRIAFRARRPARRVRTNLSAPRELSRGRLVH